MVTSHMWVEMQVLPINVERVVLEDGEEALITSSTEHQEQFANDDAVHGCYVCNAPLNLDTIESSCPGAGESNAA